MTTYHYKVLVFGINGGFSQEGTSVDSGSEVVGSFSRTRTIQGFVSQLNEQIYLTRKV